jgi:hypothetical protein
MNQERNERKKRAEERKGCGQKKTKTGQTGLRQGQTVNTREDQSQNWAQAQFIWTPKAQVAIHNHKAQLLKPNPNWAPEISKAQLKWAPATSKHRK